MTRCARRGCGSTPAWLCRRRSRSRRPARRTAPAIPDLGAELARLAGADADLTRRDASGAVTRDAQPLRTGGGGARRRSSRSPPATRTLATTSDSGCGCITGGFGEPRKRACCSTAPGDGPRNRAGGSSFHGSAALTPQWATGTRAPPDARSRAPTTRAPATQARRGIATMQTMSAFLAGAVRRRSGGCVRGPAGDTAPRRVRRGRARRAESDRGRGRLSVGRARAVHGRGHAPRRPRPRPRGRGAVGASPSRASIFSGARYRDAARWLAEAEVHFQQQDPFNAMARGPRAAGRDRVLHRRFRRHDGVHSTVCTPGAKATRRCRAQRVPVRRAEGWALAHAQRRRGRPPAARGRRLARGDGRTRTAAGLRRAAGRSARRAGAGADGCSQRVAARDRVSHAMPPRRRRVTAPP